jgi:hypothetical protein
MNGIVKRVAVAVLLLAMLGVAACGDEPAPPVVEVPEWACTAVRIVGGAPHDARLHGIAVDVVEDGAPVVEAWDQL